MQSAFRPSFPSQTGAAIRICPVQTHSSATRLFIKNKKKNVADSMVMFGF